MIAQSLWRDGDLKIENNHQRGDYREYYPGDLDPHYLTRGTDQEIYSIHPIGIAVLLAPIYALAGYQGAVWALILMGALAAALAWRWTVATLNAPGAATFAWAAIALSAPFMFNTFTIYPEIAAALAVMFALTTTLRHEHRSLRHAALDRRGPGDRVAAVAEHEIRADVGRPAPRRDFPSRLVRTKVNLLHFYANRKSGRWWRFMRSRSRVGSHFSTRSGESRCRWRPMDRWCRPRR